MGDLRTTVTAYLAALDADIAALDDPEAHEDIARLLERSLAALPALRAAVATSASVPGPCERTECAKARGDLLYKHATVCAILRAAGGVLRYPVVSGLLPDQSVYTVRGDGTSVRLTLYASEKDMVAGRRAVAADTGWRDRPPTETEVRAHAEAHENAIGTGSWQWRDGDGLVHTAHLYTDDGLWSWTYGAPSASTLPRHAVAWRPLTAEGDPAPWPEVML